ncbi:helix-turn-helix domain-containing protein [Nocardia goodfellowii]
MKTRLVKQTLLRENEDLLSIGETIEMRRRERRLSRRTVANLVGRSEEWLRLVENGKQKLDSVRILVRLCEVLQIDISQLLELPHRVPSNSTYPGDVTIQPIVRALSARSRRGDADPGPETASLLSSLEDLRRCQSDWNNSSRRYSLVLQRLPSLIHASRQLCSSEPAEQTADLLVQTYHLSCQFLLKLGAYGHAWIAADRAMERSLQLGTKLATAASAWHLSHALLHLTHANDSREEALIAAGELAEEVPESVTEAILWGGLQLAAARAAARMRDTMEMDRLLDRASAATHRAGSDGHIRGVSFGPREIGLAKMEIALEHQNVEDAIAVASELEIPDEYPVGSRARYHIILAYSFATNGHDVAAAYELAAAAQICEEELRFDRQAHRTLQILLRRDDPFARREVARLTELARLGHAKPASPRKR